MILIILFLYGIEMNKFENGTLHFGDLHLGVQADSEWMQNIQRDTIKRGIEYSKENDIKAWILYGDIFDVRRAITHKTMEFARELFTEIGNNGIYVYALVGNHDAHYKNTLFPNAVQELLGSYDFVKVVQEPTTIDVGFTSIDLIPWICDDNQELITKYIAQSSSEMCIGHFELNGFYFYKGVKSHGTEPDFLRKYKWVKSGHFHTKSKARNVEYIGTPYTITAGDEDDIRGFYHLTENDFKFIVNPKIWHRKITYPTSKGMDLSELENCSVRLVVTSVDNDLDKFQTELESKVHSLSIISSVVRLEEGVVEQSMKSTLQLFEEVITNLEIDDNDKPVIKTMVSDLYNEANSL